MLMEQVWNYWVNSIHFKCKGPFKVAWSSCSFPSIVIINWGGKQVRFVATVNYLVYCHVFVEASRWKWGFVWRWAASGHLFNWTISHHLLQVSPPTPWPYMSFITSCVSGWRNRIGPVHLSFCLSICVCVSALMAEPLDLRTQYLVQGWTGLNGS